MTKIYHLKEGIADFGDANPIWIIETSFYLFNLIKRRKVIGKYEIDDTYGKMGQIPFFCYKEAR